MTRTTSGPNDQAHPHLQRMHEIVRKAAAEQIISCPSIVLSHRNSTAASSPRTSTRNPERTMYTSHQESRIHCLMSYPSPEPILNACSLLWLYGVRLRIVYASSLDARSTVDWEWIPTTRGSWATNSPCPSVKLCNYKAYYYYYPQDRQRQRNSQRASQAAARNPKIRGKSPGTSQSLKASRPANPPPRYGDAMAGGTCNV